MEKLIGRKEEEKRTKESSLGRLRESGPRAEPTMVNLILSEAQIEGWEYGFLSSAVISYFTDFSLEYSASHFISTRDE